MFTATIIIAFTLVRPCKDKRLYLHGIVPQRNRMNQREQPVLGVWILCSPRWRCKITTVHLSLAKFIFKKRVSGLSGQQTSHDRSQERWQHYVCLTLKALHSHFLIFTHLKLCLATATHNFKRVKISHMCLIWHQPFVNPVNRHTFRFQ